VSVIESGIPPIPVTRLDQADPILLEELLEVVGRVARKGAFTGGPEVEAFETEFAVYCGSRHAVGISNGTEAISLALRALGVGPGDEVIVPTNSFIATAEAVSWIGATPKLVDVDPKTHLLTAEHVAAAIGPRTRCVIPVHLMGSTVDLEPIMDLAR
jgi:dTDP-3-amino-3,4,6-trideoxy-alpha-D-glucose transaminase